MGLDVDKLMNWPFAEVEQSYTSRDSILYALGLGLNMDPLDEQQLKFTYEEGMQALIADQLERKPDLDRALQSLLQMLETSDEELRASRCRGEGEDEGEG